MFTLVGKKYNLRSQVALDNSIFIKNIKKKLKFVEIQSFLKYNSQFYSVGNKKSSA